MVHFCHSYRLSGQGDDVLRALRDDLANVAVDDGEASQIQRRRSVHMLMHVYAYSIHNRRAGDWLLYIFISEFCCLASLPVLSQAHTARQVGVCT